MKPALKPLMATCALTLLIAQAFQARAVDMNFSGVLTEDAPCTINGGNPIDVTFPDVHVNVVMAGSAVPKDIPLNLVCSGGSNRTVALTITGQGYTGDGTALQSSNANQGLKFYKDAGATQNWDLTTPWTWVDSGQAAAPTTAWVKQISPASGLTGGPFTAAATILSSYQ
jgi:spore coat protein U-like protein